MDFETFKKSARLLPKDISIIMRGRHGIGKTEVVRQLAQEFGLPLVERRLAQLTEGDLLGLPHNYDNKATEFLPPLWFVKAIDNPYMIFLDEFDRASREVQQAAMELILERSIQGKVIHEDSRVYAAINGGKHGSSYQVINLDPAIYDRFWIADCEPSIIEWLNWARKNGVHKDIINFISTNKDLLEQDVKNSSYKVSPSRRSWTRFSRVLTTNSEIIKNIEKTDGKRLFISLSSGFVGNDATSRFKDFLQNPENHIMIEDILDYFDENEERFKNLKIEHLNLAIEKISEDTKDNNRPEWTKNQIKNLDKFFRMLSPELRMTMWYKISNQGSKIENAQRLSVFISDLIISVIG